MKFCLNTTIIKPEQHEKIYNDVILLHGYGGDGKDISMLTLNWKRFLKNTVFLCPDAHEVCNINPVGFQWFDLSSEDPKNILIESKKAENKIKHNKHYQGDLFYDLSVQYVDLYLKKFMLLK